MSKSAEHMEHNLEYVCCPTSKSAEHTHERTCKASHALESEGSSSQKRTEECHGTNAPQRAQILEGPFQQERYQMHPVGISTGLRGAFNWNKAPSPAGKTHGSKASPLVRSTPLTGTPLNQRLLPEQVVEGVLVPDMFIPVNDVNPLVHKLHGLLPEQHDACTGCAGRGPGPGHQGSTHHDSAPITCSHVVRSDAAVTPLLHPTSWVS